MNAYPAWGCIVVSAAILLSPAAARAQGVKLDDPALARVSDAIVTGRVVSIGYGRDPQVPYIYTYVTIEVDEHIKGVASGNQLVVKQLGGQVGGVQLAVYDQAEFAFGEEVLLFLVERPRDGTLQTTGLWQGKWTITRDPVSGDGEVTRTPFGSLDRANSANPGEFKDVRLLEPFVAELRNWSGPPDDEVSPMRRLNTQPVEAAAARPAFNLIGTPARWNQADSGTPVRVDIQASGQPGLAGGGFTQIGSARGLWNNAGSALTLAPGTNVLNGASTTTLCNDTSNPNSGRITVYFADPCAEIANDDSVLAVGGFWSTSSGGETVNGQAFNRITSGFVINNDDPSLQPVLSNSACFLDLETHEIGHAIGIGHNSVPGSIMNPTLDPACLSGSSTGLGNDDSNAINFIYPRASTPGDPFQRPGPPRGLTYTLDADRVILEWLPPVTGGPVSSYQIQGGAAPGKLNFANFDTFQNATKINLKIKDGEYHIRIRARNSAGMSVRSSNEVTFVVTGNPSVPNPAFVAPTLNAVVDAFGNVLVMGEVQNQLIGDGPPAFIRVQATFNSASGSIVGTDFTFVHGRSRRLRASGIVTDTTLLAGQRGCFMMFTNIPATQVDEVFLELSYDTVATDSLQGRLQLREYSQQEDALGNLQMTGTASNVGSRTTYFNRIVFDVKTPKVQTCDFTFVSGSTVGLPGGGTTSTGLFPGQVGTFQNFTNVPFGPVEVRRYPQWDETAPAGAGSALATLARTDAKAHAILARIEADRSILRQSIFVPGTTARHPLHELRNQIEARLQQLEERMAPPTATGRVRLADFVVLPVRLEPNGPKVPARR